MRGDSSDAKKASSELRRQMNSDINAIEGDFDRFDSASKKSSEAFSSFAGNLASTAVSALSSALIAGGKAILDYSARMEQTKIAFTSLIGNSQKATKHLEDLKRFAIDTPFEFEGLATASQRLQGANVELEKVIPLMTSIGNIVSATGATTEDRLNGITTAIAQMIGKTKVSAEEMEQLSERGVQGWAILSEATGKTQAELRKLSEQGKLSADVMVAALQKIGREKFGDAMEKQSKTFNGAISSIKDILMQTAEKAFAPWYKEISQFTAKLAADLAKQTPQAKSISEKFGESLGESFAKGWSKHANWENLLAFMFKAPFQKEAFDFGVGFGKGLAKTPQNVAPKVYNYARPDSPGMNTDLVPINPIVDAEKERKEREKAIKDYLADLGQFNQTKLKIETEAYERGQKLAEDDFESKKLTQEQFQAISLKQLENYEAAARKLINEGFAIAKQGKKGIDLAQVEAEYGMQIKKLDDLVFDTKASLEKKITETVKKQTEERTKNSEEEVNRQIELLKKAGATAEADLQDRFKRELLIESQYLRQSAWLKVQNLEREKALLLTLEQTPEIQQKIKLLDEDINQQRLENYDQVLKAIQLENAELEKTVGTLKALDAAKEKSAHDGDAQVGDGADPAGADPGWLTTMLEGFGLGIESMTAPIEMMNTLGGMLAGTFNQISDAVGNAVRSFVLFGNSGGSFRKFVAEMLSAIASAAAVQALWEMAQWAAMTALFIFSGNPAYALAAGAHLTAAIIYGSIAGVAALAGRAMAGDSFKKETSGAYGSAGQSSPGNRSTPENDDAKVIELSRNTPSSGYSENRGQSVRDMLSSKHQVTIKLDKGLIAEEIEEDVRGNGRIRRVFIEVAEGV